jgi:hypothetical protein
MRSPAVIDPRWRRLLLLLTVLGVLLLAFLSRGLVRDYVARPLLYGIWHAWNMSRGFPQVLVWAIFVATIPVIAVFNLVVGGKQEEPQAPAEPPPAQGQITTLTGWIRQASLGDYYRTRLYRYLSTITLGTLGYREQLSQKEVRARIKQGQIHLEKPVLESIRLGWRKLEGGPDRDDVPANGAGDVVTPQLERVIAFIEQELEIDNAN